MLPRVLRAATCIVAAGTVVALAPGCGGETKKKAAPTPPAQHFRTRPDLRPPRVKVNKAASGTADGLIFLAPKEKVAQAGPLILDGRGQVVWFLPLETKAVADFKEQVYHGRPVLTWWRGKAPLGVGSGFYTIYDSSYHHVADVRAGNGLDGDIHEFLITPRNTALFTVYHRLPWDLSSVGGPKQGKIFDGIVQELDIASGRVLWEWKASDHVPVEESYAKVPNPKKGAKAAPYDYFHVNSIDEEDDGNFLVSARNTHTVYKIERKTGAIMWRLGGKKSDFAMGPGTTFNWQHDARRQPDGTITLFDNGAAPPVEKFTRVLVLRVDEQAKRATLVRTFVHPRRVLVPFEGNAQFLPDGHVFVGWGGVNDVTEFDGQGRVLFDATFGGKGADSYRAFRFPWKGTPTGDPAVAVVRGSGDGATAYASWNGATDVTRWEVLAGPDSAHLHPVGSAPKGGFETAIRVETKASTFAVRALGRNGEILGTSRTATASG
jgi:hypothetical protein